jgi:hypothetical protein
VSGIFQELSIVVIGPLPETKDGFVYIMVVVDGLSRFVFAEPLKDTTAMTAAQYVHRLSGIFRYEEAFRWDNCRQFDNHLLKCLTDLVGTERHPSVPFNPQSNGLVERVIQEIIQHLCFIVNDRRVHDEWDVMLPIALRIINSLQHASVGLSPAQILLPGCDSSSHMYPTVEPGAVSNYIAEIRDSGSRARVQEYISNLVELQQQAIKSAREFQDNVVRRNVVTKAPEPYRKFSVGEWVTHQWRGGRPGKLSVQWQGPFKVMRQESNTMYIIQDPADLKEYRKHVRELYEYRMGLTNNPAAIIAMDKVEDLVDFIVDHECPVDKVTGRRVPKSGWRFRIRWIGCGQEEDSWLPFKEVNPLAAFDIYLQEHPELGMK